MAESTRPLRQPDANDTLTAALRVRAMLILVVVSILIGAGLIMFGNQPGQRSGLLQAVTPTPVITPGEAYRQLRATEDALLNTYGWVDRENGVVRIPIERAIDLLATRSLPSRP